MSSYPRLFQPLTVNGIVLPNRLMMGSMHTGLEEQSDGYAAMAAFYAERAQGGAGLIVTGGVSPNQAGKLGLGPTEQTFPQCAYSHRVIPDAVHQAGGNIVLQLLHAGRYSKHVNAVAPSPIASAINRNPIRELTKEEIFQTIEDFALSSGLAADVGYDGVEVMGSEGYLISQFLAERTNQRQDEWGGDWLRRKRFAVEVVKAVRQAMGDDKILVFRISILELVEGGMSAEQIVDLAGCVEQAGASLLDSGIGWHEARVPTIMFGVPHGAFGWATRRVKDAVNIPVIACNRINSPEVAERLISDGDADMVSMARPWLADASFGERARLNQADKINTCIACNQSCLDAIFVGRTASCVVNPRACRETSLNVSRVTSPRRLAVVGAGPGGLMTAMTLAERGHKVDLYESESQLGGQFNLARQVPGKQDYGETIRYFSNRFAEFDQLKVHLNTTVTAQQLVEERFDEIVLASGIAPRVPQIDGSDHARVVGYVDVLRGRVECGPRVAIVGAGGIGFDVAEFLTANAKHGVDVEHYLQDWGVSRGWEIAGGLEMQSVKPRIDRQVFLCQRGSRVGATLGKSTGWALRAGLQAREVEFLCDVSYQRIDDDGLHLLINGEPRLLEVDQVVICAGQESRRELEPGLLAAGVPVHLIGGARESSGLDAQRAMREGFELALGL